ncbi:RNA polymerase sigma factor [Costertonia aggregata]|uniref:RNA polymerase sigma factor n=1 Tax=Costertonia aggregata TaxID=343403 RepID=A0A7H9AL46_9FLAO|nr:RNA polymerase sigma factor [Costertonia aggregata]QLG44178.1 RNA polymerase sigma factor [Costertonia aggregata]
METTDTLLIQNLQSGDKNALYAIYDRYSGAIYGVILRMCKREDLAQDVLQDTFLKIWQKIHLYNPEKGKFYTWAYRIAKNTALNSLRNPSPFIQTEDLSVYTKNQTEAIKEEYPELNGMLKRLEPHHQKAIELVYFEGYTHREAHEEMGIPLGTFKSYVRQALIKLRENYPTALILLLIVGRTIAYG